jgi:hypothetical protein
MKRRNTLIIIVVVWASWFAPEWCSGSTIFLESGTDATQDNSFWTTIVGTVTSDSVGAITGPRSLKIANGATPTTASATKNSVLAAAGRRISFRFKTDTLPNAQNWIRVLNTSGTSRYAIRINSNGTIASAPAGLSIITGTTALATNNVYRIGISFVLTSATVFTINIYINGKLEISHVNTGTLTGIDWDRLEFGVNSSWPANSNAWIDDIYIDDGTTKDDPGNIIVTNKRPNANGAANNYTTQIGSGGSGYGTGHSPQVNEQPLSTTNGWSIASASAITEEYTIESAATGDVDVSSRDKSLVDYMGWIYTKTGTADTRNIIVNGVSSNISVTTSYAMYTKAAGSTSYPSGNTAIGMNNNSLVALDSLAECGILLAVKLPRRVSVTP